MVGELFQPFRIVIVQLMEHGAQGLLSSAVAGTLARYLIDKKKHEPAFPAQSCWFHAKRSARSISVEKPVAEQNPLSRAPSAPRSTGHGR